MELFGQLFGKMVWPVIEHRRHSQAWEGPFDRRHLIPGLLLDGLALLVRKAGESFLELLMIEDRDGKRADAAMTATLPAR